VPRTRRPGALDQLIEAALAVFARSGFRETQMVDVAREMGVALGTIYSYVESKEALFALVVDRALTNSGGQDHPGPGPELPLRAPETTEILLRVKERLEELTALPVLAAAVRRRVTNDAAAELQRVLEELWALIARTRLAADMVERSARDWPELSVLFYDRARRDVLDRLGTYFERRTRSGHFRSHGDAGLIARSTLETVTFWARHRYRDSAGIEAADEHVRRVILAFLVEAVTGGTAP
jgi:AcrR family transcriptional regulator